MSDSDNGTEDPNPDLSKIKFPSLQESLKELSLESTDQKIARNVKSAAKRGLSFFKTAKDALTGDDKAKEKLSEAYSNAAIKTHDAIDHAGELIDRTKSKIEKKLDDRAKGKSPGP